MPTTDLSRLKPLEMCRAAKGRCRAEAVLEICRAAKGRVAPKPCA